MPNPDKSTRNVAEGAWQSISDLEGVRIEENGHSLSVVVRIPPIDALIESGYVRAVNPAPETC